ncbi:hypothetical protein BBF96_00845 [Anoxybacter fermentans]|uniref:LysM domain-containing protein n=1 Tax=Anoxybacter fermentans TaxID=1323375 RepID=A0A3S9SUS9_9FIRM|nr:M23 family metallopeptidase [Anoxybacter fermentans]AZR72063.1 hypothetical protein BBF96_00845 [Anoxybacter fermentans]
MKAIYQKFLSLTLVTAFAGITVVAPAKAAEPIHKVRSGESLWSIAQKYHMDVETLARINGIRNPEYIKVGMELKLGKGPQIYKVKPGESIWSISKKFGISYKTLVRYNNLKNPDKIFPGMEIKIPAKVGVKSKHKQRYFIWPAKGRVSSSFGFRWGRMHNGVDIALPVGRDVRAAAGGKVIWGGWINGYGYTVIIEHSDGYRTLYAHNSRVLVRGGDWVKQGQIIAKSGNTGRSTGPHLHFEIQKDGRPVDPMIYIKDLRR